MKAEKRRPRKEAYEAIEREAYKKYVTALDEFRLFFPKLTKAREEYLDCKIDYDMYISVEKESKKLQAAIDKLESEL